MDELKTNHTLPHPLDQVVLHALTSKQRHLALGNHQAMRFPVTIGPFAAIVDTTPASFSALSTLIDQHGPLALVTPEAIQPPPGLKLVRHVLLMQMVWSGALDSNHQFEHVELSQRDVPEMVALTAATEPGPFGVRTIELGHYIGVRSGGKLAAMAGERMRLDGYSEISAVCVDPEFRGQGHAANLMKLLIAAMLARNETPFLHVLESNRGALRIYQNLGFTERRAMHLTVLAAT